MQSNRHRLTTTILAGLILLGSAVAQPAGYSFRKKLSIQSSQVSGSVDLTNFPILVSITDGDLKSAANGGGTGRILLRCKSPAGGWFYRRPEFPVVKKISLRQYRAWIRIVESLTFRTLFSRKFSRCRTIFFVLGQNDRGVEQSGSSLGS